MHNFSKAVFSHLTADHIISLSSSLCRRHAFVALVPILLVLVLLVLLVFVLFVCVLMFCLESTQVFVSGG